jgi:hypothetical protein
VRHLAGLLQQTRHAKDVAALKLRLRGRLVSSALACVFENGVFRAELVVRVTEPVRKPVFNAVAGPLSPPPPPAGRRDLFAAVNARRQRREGAVRGFDDHHRRAFDRVASAEARRAFELVHLRFFAGLPLAEVAQLLGISTLTAHHLGSYARAWLYQEIQGAPKEKNEKKRGVIWPGISHSE